MRILMLGIECHHITLRHLAEHTLAYASPEEKHAADQEARERFGNAGVTLYDSLDEALREFRPELAVIGVPNIRKNRFDIERRLIDRGIPILEYKLRLSDIDSLRDFLREPALDSVPVYIGEPYVYTPCVLQLHKELANGALGEPEYLRWRCALGGGAYGWMQHYEHLSLEDLGLHHFSVLHFLFGLADASVVSRSLSPSKGEGMTGTVCDSWLSWPGGFAATHGIDWINAVDETDYLGTIALECTRGAALIRGEKLYMGQWGEPMQEIAPTVTADPLAEMVALLTEGKTPRYMKSIRDFAPVMEKIDGALRG